MRNRNRLSVFLALSILLCLVAPRSPASAQQGSPSGAKALAADGCRSTTPVVFVGDFDANTTSDLGIFWPDDNSFHVRLSIETRFGAPDSGEWVAPNAFGNRNGQYYVGDFNGDDKADLGFFSPGDNSFHVSLSTGKGFDGVGSGRWIAPGAFGHKNGQYYVGYFNGGKKADLGFFDPGDNSFHVSLSTGSGFNAPHSGRWIAPNTFGHAGGAYYVGDYNDDGSEDLGFFEPADNSFYVSLSNGEGFGASGSGRWIAPNTFGHRDGQYYVGDYNGDDKADLGFFNPGDNSFHVSLSTGSSFGRIGSGRWIAPDAFGHENGQYYVGFFNGGKKADLGFFNFSNNSYHVSLSTGSGFGAAGSGQWASLNLCRVYLPLAFDMQR